MVREGTVEEVIQLCHEIPEFKNTYAKSEFDRRLSQNDSMILIAEDEGIPVAFKCGYRRSDLKTYYSWMGGVVPNYRNKGYARMLLKEMEDRATTLGYQKLSFKTLNEHKAMLIFALKHGFEIIDVAHSKKDTRPRIWLSKKL